MTEALRILTEDAHADDEAAKSADPAFSRARAVAREQGLGADTGTARRFADEARITAQLQHPGIPPVHDIGALPDGRPFLAMKLIKGRTLEALLESRPDPPSERGRFVAVFEQVCQALAFAHSHGIIHRDLKPANVMVGAFGEVQVMDWGLAKVLASRERERPENDPEETTALTRVATLRDSDGSFTLAGSVLGTPAYMPPEQAVGAVGKVDRRSDVFGLGAILAVILTGRPPFAAGSSETIRVLSAQGRLDECFAQLDGCGADPELVALCRRCLSPSPAARPADAGEVAHAVADLRTAADERARRAELERVQAEGEKAAAQLQAEEQRKRRQVQLALAVAVGVLLLGGGGFAWWSAAQAQAAYERQGRNAEAVAGLLDQCEEALRGGDPARAAVSLEAARKRAPEGGTEASAARLDALTADLALLRDLDAVDQFRWTTLDGKKPDKAAVAARYREALGHYGADPDAASPAEAAARASGSALRDRISAALDWLLREEKTAGVRAALQTVDADPYRDAMRDAVGADDREKIADLAARPAALEQPPEFAACLGESEAIAVDRRRQLLKAAVGRRPADLSLLMTMGYTYPINQEEGAGERLRWFQAAVAAAPTNLTAYSGLANALTDNKDLAGAEAACREAIRLDPKFAMAFTNLGNVLNKKMDLAGAEAACREAIRLDPKLAMAQNNLGWALQQKGDRAGAESAYREAIRIDPNLALAHTNLGNLLLDRNDLAGAEAAYREVIRIDHKLANPHINLGWALQQKGDLEGALAEFKEVLRIDPKNSYVLSHLPTAERMRQLSPRLADILAGKAEPETSEEACAFAELCGQPFQKRYAAAGHLFEGAFKADPKLAADLTTGYRYDAACCAIRAAAGEGIDPPADTAARTALREKALGWLRADLDLRRKQAASADATGRATVAPALSHWLVDTDLSGVRDPERLAKLPAAEREEWGKLWADVKATLADAQEPAPQPETEPGKK